MKVFENKYVIYVEKSLFLNKLISKYFSKALQLGIIHKRIIIKISPFFWKIILLSELMNINIHKLMNFSFEIIQQETFQVLIVHKKIYKFNTKTNKYNS